MSLKYRYRKQILIAMLIIIFIASISTGLYFLFSNSSKKEGKAKPILVTAKKKETVKEKKEEEETSEIMVDIKGAVVAPGIYKLKENQRVIDAINMAGGVTEQGDTSVLNLSKKLSDEMVIIVYSYDQVSRFQEVQVAESMIQEKCMEGVNNIPNDACYETKEENIETGKKVSVNQATMEELMTLEGIGQSKAQAIIAYREEHGPFTKIEDLLNVSGIGEELFAKIKETITL